MQKRIIAQIIQVAWNPTDSSTLQYEGGEYNSAA